MTMKRLLRFATTLLAAVSTKDYSTLEEMYPGDTALRTQRYDELKNGFKVAWEKTFTTNRATMPKLNLLQMYYPTSK